MKKILIIRTDRMGDVLLTTPLMPALRASFPDVQIDWLVRPYTAPLLQNNPMVRRILLETDQPLSELIQTIRAEQYDVAIVAYPRWRACWAVWKAGIPIRVGPASKLYSVLLNRRLHQHRSLGQRHEADYNLELLGPLGISFERQPTQIVLMDEERQEARKVLLGHRLMFEKPIVILHPGSGGSSPRWPLRSFMLLGDRLQREGVDVVVTSGPGETYQNIMIDQMDRIPVFIPAGSVSLREFAAVLSWASVVVTNSTGPLHLSAALHIPTVSVFSKEPTCHPVRWGPYPSYAQKDAFHGVLVADNDETDRELSQVTVDAVWQEIKQRLQKKNR